MWDVGFGFGAGCIGGLCAGWFLIWVSGIAIGSVHMVVVVGFEFPGSWLFLLPVCVVMVIVWSCEHG